MKRPQASVSCFVGTGDKSDAERLLKDDNEKPRHCHAIFSLVVRLLSETLSTPFPRFPVATASRNGSATQLSASAWGRLSTSASSPLWSNLVDTTSAFRPSQLILAFVLGGIFFSRLLPGLLTWAVACFRRVQKWWKQLSSDESAKASTRRQEKSSNNSLQFTSVPTAGLVVVQHVVERLAGRSFQTQMRRALLQGLNQVSNANIRSVELISLVTNPTPDTTSPRLLQGRIYQFSPGDDDDDNSSTAMAFDVDLQWDNCVEAELQITTQRFGLPLPIRVENVRWKGPVRCILTPLSDEPPGFGACLVSLPRLPDVLDLDVVVAGGQVTQVPWLRQELLQTLQDVLTQRVVWPQRIVNPMLQVPPEPANNYNITTILTRSELKALEKSDPLLDMERQRAKARKRKTKRRWGKQNQTAIDDDDDDDDDSSILDSDADHLQQTGENVTLWDKVLDSLVQPLSKFSETKDLPFPPSPNNITQAISNRTRSNHDDDKEGDDDGLFQLGNAIEQMTQVESLEEFLALWNDDDDQNNNKDDENKKENELQMSEK